MNPAPSERSEETLPLIETSPSVGAETPARMLRMVLFPEPLGPMIPTHSPFCIEKDTPSSAQNSCAFPWETRNGRMLRMSAGFSK